MKQEILILLRNYNDFIKIVLKSIQCHSVKSICLVLTLAGTKIQLLCCKHHCRDL